MAKKTDVSDMKLTSVLKEWMDQEELKNEIQINDQGNGAVVVVNVGINDQSHRLFLETDEDGEVFTIALFTPFNVPAARMADMSRILNRLNGRIRFGKLVCDDDEDSNRLSFQQAIDVEGSTLVPKQISNMMVAAMGTLDSQGELLAAVALTKQPIDALWADFLEEFKKEETEEEESGPSEL